MTNGRDRSGPPRKPEVPWPAPVRARRRKIGERLAGMDAYTPPQESTGPLAASVASSGNRRKGRGVIAALVLLPLLVMAANAWSAWRGTWHSAAADLERTAAAGAEFGLRVLSAHAVAAGRVDAVLRGLSDDEIRARERELHAELKALVVEVPQAEASYVVDRDGYPLVSANLYPLPRDRPLAADRDFFIALRGEGAPDLHVSRVHEGRYDGLPFFAVSRRRTRTGNTGLQPGAFDGLVNLSLYPDRLRTGLSRVSGHPGDAVALIRDDGAVLVRGGGPEGAPGFPGNGHALVRPMQGSGGALYREGEGAEEAALVAVRQVEGWPVHAAASRTRRAIVSDWQDTVAAQLAVGLPASLALLGLALLLHRSQDRLALANAGLEARVAQRTAELAGSEARFRATFEQAAIGIAHVGLDGLWLRVNRRLCGMLGYEEGELLARSFRDITHPDDLPADAEAIHRLVTGEVETCTLEKRYLRRDGSGLWVDLTISLMRDGHGQPFAFLAAIGDNSARKAAEAALASREAEFRAIFASTLIGMVQAEAATGRFLRVNPHFCEIVGYREEELLGGMSVPDISHPDDLRTDHGNIRRALEAVGRYEGERRLVRKDGLVIRVVMHVSLIDPPGAGAGGAEARLAASPLSVAAVQDITERRRAEERQALLAREVDHRAKNVLTVVQAALRLTPKRDAAAYASAVEGRVLALARAHTLLSEARWHGAALRGVVEAELAAFLPGPAAPEGAARAVLEGPDLLLMPISVQPLAMVLHELATNATKHGALSVPGGALRLAWRIDEAAGLLRLRWEERGGPVPGPPPARPGFGTRVVEATIREQLGGRLSRHWEEAGLAYDVEIPLARVVAGRAEA